MLEVSKCIPAVVVIAKVNFGIAGVVRVMLKMMIPSTIVMTAVRVEIVQRFTSMMEVTTFVNLRLEIGIASTIAKMIPVAVISL